jgi:hypothetical protein
MGTVCLQERRSYASASFLVCARAWRHSVAMPSNSCAKHSRANSTRPRRTASLHRDAGGSALTSEQRSCYPTRSWHGTAWARVSVLQNSLNDNGEHEDAHAHCNRSSGGNTCGYRASSACIAGSRVSTWHQDTWQRSAKKERWHRFWLCAHRATGNSLEPGASPRRIGRTRPTRRSQHAQRNAAGSGSEQKARYSGRQIAPTYCQKNGGGPTCASPIVVE